MRFPNFFIIGGQRCGTTSLRVYLSLHPDVYMPPGETSFFSHEYARGIKWYQSLFHDRPVLGEKSADYLSHPETPERISKLVPGARFIVLLRNPVDRAWSHYRWAVTMGREHEPFTDALRFQLARGDSLHSGYLQRGCYVDQLKRWLNFFPLDRFLIIESETLFSQPDTTCSEVLRFLQLRGCCGTEVVRLKRLGRHGKVKAERQMKLDTRRWLDNYYRPYNKQLEDLLGRKFRWDPIVPRNHDKVRG